ncbi:hypothetical protein ABV152_004204 [Escherichia coli]|uniref:Uncharacterized protein n=7 Tax=Enterobacterales TaxID=91347 RepID=A0A746V6T7_SALER|nr:hypothetical protein [Escherichia coli]EAB8037102.1 hypothetical protein [Salmonella enterica subsp. enterica serovar Derby]EAV4529182.1 hypothetical protein [Salmonella enterica]EBP9612311.1 hypothetical protein [Salmonella enterica subsp. enterica]EBY9047890.1 hypothetical protein [Salmonella enterica subsp. enterica serovar Give]ECD0227179.1 hypothetical protein [Salmonella enterica subsp. enterica serovar Enteritidis]ECF5978230.1 hypothetical protein [Salmonella enterica subsp. arizona
MNINEIIKYSVAIITPIIQMLAVRSGWVFPKDKIFNSRKNISEFAYNLYKNTEDPKIKKVAYNYGIAAITKDKNLTPEQREILLGVNDPVNDIDNYSKCQKLISISSEKQIFKWTKKRYRFWIYRKSIKLISLTFYFIGGFITSIPFVYEGLVTQHILEKINKLTDMQRLGMSSYFFALGICIALMNLHKFSTIRIAEKTIRSNLRKPTDFNSSSG